MDLLTITEEILNGELHFLCSVRSFSDSKIAEILGFDAKCVYFKPVLSRSIMCLTPVSGPIVSFAKWVKWE